MAKRKKKERKRKSLKGIKFDLKIPRRPAVTAKQVSSALGARKKVVLMRVLESKASPVEKARARKILGRLQ